MIPASTVSGQVADAANPGGGGWNWWTSTDKNGVGTKGIVDTGLGALQGITNAWLGMQQYGLAKKTLQENTRQFNLNYDAQKRTTNASLEDRQRARVASNSGAYQSVGDYMSKNGIQ